MAAGEIWWIGGRTPSQVSAGCLGHPRFKVHGAKTFEEDTTPGWVRAYLVFVKESTGIRGWGGEAWNNDRVRDRTDGILRTRDTGTKTCFICSWRCPQETGSYKTFQSADLQKLLCMKQKPQQHRQINTGFSISEHHSKSVFFSGFCRIVDVDFIATYWPDMFVREFVCMFVFLSGHILNKGRIISFQNNICS